MKLRNGLAFLVGILVCVAVAGCDAGKATRDVKVSTLGDPQHGRELVVSYGCGACHMIPGVHGARGKVGPPLFYFAERTMIAGELPNTPENLAKWIEHPKQIEPGTAMPDLGVQPNEAREITAFLYTLRGPEGTSWID